MNMSENVGKEVDNMSKEKSDGRNHQKVDIDKILTEEVGQFSIFQIKIILQCFLCGVFGSWNMNEYVFTAGRIETRCVIPECEDTIQTEFSPTWIANAVPWSGGSMHNCQRYGNASLAWLDNSTCPAALFNTSILKRCDEYLYKSTNTIVYDYDLACKEWRRAFVGSVRVLGIMISLAITGYISDRWGRRRALAISAFSSAVLGVTRYWAPNYAVYMLLLFLESIVGGGSYTCAYVIVGELFGPKHRVKGGALMNSIHATGGMTLGLIAWAVNSWKNLILVLYIPQFITVICFWTMPESMRWLMSKGRIQQLEDLLKEATRLSGKDLSQKSIEGLRLNAFENRKKETSDRRSLILLVLKNKRILIRCFVTGIWWMTATLVYYGLSINALTLTGNKNLNYVIAAAVDFPGYLIMSLIVDRIGRKPTMIFFFWICAASQAAFIFISKDQVVISLTIYMIGKFAIAVVIGARNIYTIELFPTDCRHRLYSFSSMIGRLGSMVAPLTPALGATLFTQLPFVLFGGMAFLAGLVTFLVPETLGSKLADTMDETHSLKLREIN